MYSILYYIIYTYNLFSHLYIIHGQGRPLPRPHLPRRAGRKCVSRHDIRHVHTVYHDTIQPYNGTHCISYCISRYPTRTHCISYCMSYCISYCISRYPTMQWYTLYADRGAPTSAPPGACAPFGALVRPFWRARAPLLARERRPFWRANGAAVAAPPCAAMRGGRRGPDGAFETLAAAGSAHQTRTRMHTRTHAHSLLPFARSSDALPNPTPDDHD